MSPTALIPRRECTDANFSCNSSVACSMKIHIATISSIPGLTLHRQASPAAKPRASACAPHSDTSCQLSATPPISRSLLNRPLLTLGLGGAENLQILQTRPHLLTTTCRPQETWSEWMERNDHRHGPAKLRRSRSRRICIITMLPLCHHCCEEQRVEVRAGLARRCNHHWSSHLQIPRTRMGFPWGRSGGHLRQLRPRHSLKQR